MATATQAPPSSQQKAGARPERKTAVEPKNSNTWRPWHLVDLGQLQYNIKLRTAKALNDQLSMEIGADYGLLTRQAQPIASLFYDVSLALSHAARALLGPKHVLPPTACCAYPDSWCAGS